MGTGWLTDQVLAPAGPLRPLLEDAGAQALPELRDAIKQACTHDNPWSETLILLARTQALPPGRVLSCPLPHGPEAAPIARKAARRQLEAWRVDDETAFTTELIVSELVGNATRYGTPPLHLRLILDRMLTCEVSDGAPSAPHVQHARTVDESGRGLFIIANLAEQWGHPLHLRRKDRLGGAAGPDHPNVRLTRTQPRWSDRPDISRMVGRRHSGIAHRRAQLGGSGKVSGQVTRCRAPADSGVRCVVDSLCPLVESNLAA
ncbi:ATP-binding protein [Streptomyces sp. NPDC002758]